jgi:hypothetical protein
MMRSSGDGLGHGRREKKRERKKGKFRSILREVSVREKEKDCMVRYSDGAYPRQ